MVLAAVAVLVFVAVCFLTDPVEPEVPDQDTEPTQTTAPQETTVPPQTIPDGPIGQCIRAFEAIENAEEVYIRSYNLDDESEGDFIYLRSPQGWLHQYWQGRNAPEPTRWLRYGNEQYLYERDVDENWMPVGAYHWSVEQNPRNHSFDLSSMVPFCYDWDFDTLELLDHRTENRQEIIQFFYPLYADIFTFCFQDGKLQYFDHGDDSGDPSAVTIRREVIWEGDVSVTEYIEQMYQEAHSICGDGRTVEARFQDAWARFTAAEQLHLTEKFSYHMGENTEDSGEISCWIDEENWLRTEPTPMGQLSSMMADGNYFQKLEHIDTWSAINPAVADPPSWAFRIGWETVADVWEAIPEDGLNYYTVLFTGALPVDLDSLGIDLEWGEWDTYTVRFCCDDQGRMHNMVLKFEKGSLQYTSALTVEQTDGQIIHSTVEAVMKSAQRG